MVSTRTKFNVGLFVALGLVVAVVAIIWLGMTHYFEAGRYFVAYFDESVQGLGKDSPVKYRGVTIGRVDSITVAEDARLIQVVLNVETELDNFKELVAKLSAVGITGIMYLELDRADPGAPDLSPLLSFSPKYPVIKTQPSDIRKFLAGAEDLLRRLQALDVEGISEYLKRALNNFNLAVEDMQIRDISNDIRTTLSNVQSALNPEKWANILDTLENVGLELNALVAHADRTVGRLDQTVEQGDEQLQKTFQAFNQVIANADAAIREAHQFIRSTDHRLADVHRQMSLSLRQVEKATRSMEMLFEKIYDHPAQVFFGEPLPEHPVERP